MSKKDSSAEALKALQTAIEKACDALARDGLYVESVSIGSRARDDSNRHTRIPAPRLMYDREIVVHLSNRPPSYATSF